MLKGKASACMSVFFIAVSDKMVLSEYAKIRILSLWRMGHGPILSLFAYLKLKESLSQGQLYHSSFPGKIIMYSVKIKKKQLCSLLSFTALIILYSRLSHFM